MAPAVNSATAKEDVADTIIPVEEEKGEEIIWQMVDQDLVLP